jgi:hypothetical protein
MALGVPAVDASQAITATKRNSASASVANALKRLERKMKLALDAVACNY